MNNKNKGGLHRGRTYLVAAFAAVALVLAGSAGAASAFGLKSSVPKHGEGLSARDGGVWIVEFD